MSSPLPATATPEAFHPAGLPSRILEGDPELFHEHFNRRSFAFRHNLAGHPLFELPRLVELARLLWATGQGEAALHAGDMSVDQRWDEAPRRLMSVLDAIARIHTSGSWVLLKSAQLDPEYRAVLDQGMEELEELTRFPLRREITWLDAYVFLASPRSVTPFHIDHESVFLLQVHGQKDVHLFDPGDRSLLTEGEIERYYAGDLSAAAFSEEKEKKANIYSLAPGLAVHNPSRGPHWVQNGDDYSVSLTFNFCLRRLDAEAPVYQVNHVLRGLGFRPTPPGKSALFDAAKRLALWTPRRRHAANKYDLLRAGVKRVARPAAFLGRVLGRRPR